MGRSRRRNREAAAARAQGAPLPRAGTGRARGEKARPGTSPAGGRRGALASLGDARRALAVELGGALVVAGLALLGTVLLAGALAPWLVLLVVAAAARLLHRRTRAQLAGLPLSDDDRMLQTMAGGLLVLAVGYAAVAAIVLTVAG